MRTVPVRSRLSIGILAAGLLVGAAAGAVIGGQQHAVYRATATVFVSSTQVSTIGDPSYVGESTPPAAAPGRSPTTLASLDPLLDAERRVDVRVSAGVSQRPRDK